MTIQIPPLPTGYRYLTPEGLFSWELHITNLAVICIIRQKCVEKIRLALDFYIKAKPKSDNWWYNAIGAPTNLGPALILLKTGDNFGFDQKSLNYYSDSLLNYYSESAKKWPGATTGANKIWLLSSSIPQSMHKKQ